MLIELITRAIRRYWVGNTQEFAFKPANVIKLPKIDKTDLYIHIPFCKNKCPYCPYTKIEYDENLAPKYLDAILNEIEQYFLRLGKIEITSIYIGGGTPTVLINELGTIFSELHNQFNITGDICIETSPNEIDANMVQKLEEYRISLISLGVQSFDDRFLKLIGRNYKSNIINHSIDLILSSDFKSVNLDLMFALPGQTIDDVMMDLKKAIESGADQITTYPLFTFPYSTIGKYRKLKNVKMPGIGIRRKMYKSIHETCHNHGFERVSVWGFKRGDSPRYSSVTRDDYIGMGVGAGTHLPGMYYLNTFSVNEYIKTCSNKKTPIALKMDFTHEMSLYYWLYWRLYDTFIFKEQLFKLFDKNDKKLNQLLNLLRRFRLCKEDDRQIVLNERGAFWLHLLQNYFSLNYINKIWTIAKETPWPSEIRI